MKYPVRRDHTGRGDLVGGLFEPLGDPEFDVREVDLTVTVVVLLVIAIRFRQ